MEGEERREGRRRTKRKAWRIQWFSKTEQGLSRNETAHNTRQIGAYNRAIALRKSGESSERIGQKQWESHAASTVPHVHNGRYEHEHRPFSMFITVDVRRHVAEFCPTCCWVLPNPLPNFTRLIHGFRTINTKLWSPRKRMREVETETTKHNSKAQQQSTTAKHNSCRTFHFFLSYMAQ